MCSPLAAASWRRISEPHFLTPLLNVARRKSAYQRSLSSEELGGCERDSESFRAFASLSEILSTARRVQTADNISSSAKWKRLPLVCKANYGLALTTASGVLFSVASLFVKLSNTTVPAFEIIFVRLFLQTLMVVPPSIYTRTNLLGSKKLRPYLLIFGAFNFLSISSIYGAFTKLPLGDATVVISTTPVFTAILAYFVLHEPWHKVDAISTFICLLGVVLITRPTFIFSTGHKSEGHHLIGYLVALVGAILQSVTFIMVRAFGKSISFLISVFYFGWCSAVLAAISMFAFQTPVIPDCGAPRWFVIGVAVFGVMGSLCLNHGLQVENAAPAALMRNVDILFAFVFDVVVFNQKLHALTMAGGSLVILSTCCVVTANWFRARKKETQTL